MILRATILFSLFFVASLSIDARDQIWSEKPEKSKYLVQLPSIQPIIDALDATIVNIASTASANSEDQNSNGNRRQMPLDPFSNPEEFFERFFGPGPRQGIPRRATGSGFIISADGYILTNNHVIDGADKVEISVNRNINKGKKYSMDPEKYEAEIIGRDPRTDVALLKVKPRKPLPFAPLGNSEKLRKGDWVVAMGNPFGLDHSVSVGIVSAKDREISPNENRRFDAFIQTDAAINFGNSGGPLVNLKGEVVGINTAITAQGSGIGFAVPINMVKDIIPQLRERGSVARGYLGVMIQDVNEEMKNALGLPNASGVLINDIAPDGPAAKSSLKAGDVIVRVDDKRIPDSRSLQRVIGRSKPNSTVSIEVIRDGNRRKLRVKLGSLDSAEPQQKKVEKKEFDRIGLIVDDVPGSKAVEVQDADPEGVAVKAGVRPGDQILHFTFRSKKYRIRSAEDYSRILSALKKGESVLMNIARPQPGDQMLNIFVAFKMP